MAEKIKVAIGAPTYNSVDRLNNLLTSIELHTDFPKENFKIVILDDGTLDLNKRKQLANLAMRFDVPLIQHEKNEGIPAAWNSLTNYFDAELVILLNDDIQVSNANWLKSFVYVMDNNPKVGNIGFPVIHMNPETGLRNESLPMPDENAPIGKVGAPNGCSFGFRRELWGKIVNPDASIGFYSDLRSFYEEISFGFEISKLGYYCIQLPTPFLEHYGSRTFSLNLNLATREISSHLLKEEYLLKLKENKNLWVPYETHEKLALENNFALRMDYSRMLFAKHWDCKDWLFNPQQEVHSRITDKLERIKIKYLDKDMNEKECEI